MCTWLMQVDIDSDVWECNVGSSRGQAFENTHLVHGACSPSSSPRPLLLCGTIQIALAACYLAATPLVRF
jgi:hypothetical protein